MMRMTFVLMTGFLASAAMADTVAWWRFNDKTSGTVTQQSDTFANAVNADLFPAHPAVFYTKAATKSYEPELMPQFTSFAPNDPTLRIYDPVSGETHTTRTAMYCPWAGNGSQKNGGAWIANDPRLISQGEGDSGNFTFECFFRTTAEGIARSSNMQALGGQMGVGNGAWDIMIYQGRLWMRVCCKDANGTVYNDSIANTMTVTPDVWHHAAITFSTDGTFRLYLDYKNAGSCRPGGASAGTRYLAPKSATEPIYIGMSTYNNDRGYEGEIAEVRISNEALTSDQFLRFNETFGDRTAQGDADTVVWYSFDTPTYMDAFLVSNRGLMPSSAIYATGETLATRTGVCGAQPVEDALVRSAVRTTSTSANRGSLDVRLDDDKQSGPYLRIYEGTPLPNSDFTEEFVFRYDKEHTHATANFLDLFQAPWARLFVDTRADGFYMRLFGTGGGDFGSLGGRYMDGNWHHVAFTYEKASNTFKYYYDHILQKTVTYTPTATALGDHRISCAARSQDVSCWVDEFRITKRVLTPAEFIDFGPLGPNTLVHIPFDGNMHVRGAGFCQPERGANWSSHNPPDVTPTNAAYAVHSTINLRDGVNKTVANTGSVNINGGYLCYEDMKPLLGRSNVTVEFFVRFKGLSGCRAALLGLAQDYDIGADAAVANKVAWRFGMQHGNWSDATLYFYCCTTNVATGGAVKVQSGVAASPTYAFTSGQIGNDVAPTDYDDQWHHVAATIEELGEGDNVKTRVTTYWDYAQRSQQTFTGKLHIPSATRIAIGRNGAYSYRWLPCDIDELRISAGVLAPTAFIHRKQTLVIGIY